jgi:hypothetical protein
MIAIVPIDKRSDKPHASLISSADQASIRTDFKFKLVQLRFPRLHHYNSLGSRYHSSIVMPNEKAVVLGVLVDPVWSCGMPIERDSGETVHEIVSSLWATLVNQVDKDSTPEITDLPSATDIFLGVIDSSAAFIDRPDPLNHLSAENNGSIQGDTREFDRDVSCGIWDAKPMVICWGALETE